MRKAFWMRWLLVVFVCAGCASYVQPPQELAVSMLPDGITYSVKTAVDGTGLHHYAWMQCTSNFSTCSVTYVRMKLHQELERLEFAAPATMGYYLSDMVALNDGTVFITWREFPSSTGRAPQGISTGTDYVISIPATITTDPVPQSLAGPGQANINGFAFLATNNTAAYVVYHLQEGSNTGLFTRKIAPAVEPAMLIGDYTDELVYDVVGAVDSLDRLQLAIQYLDSINDYGAMYHLIVTAGQPLDSEIIVEGLSTNWDYILGDIAIGANDTAYVVYANDVSPENTLHIFKRTAADVSSKIDVLDGTSGLEWQLGYAPRLGVIANTLYMAFTARTTTTGNDREVWLYIDPQNAAGELQRLTDNDQSESTPELTTSSVFTAVAWRNGSTVQPAALLGLPCAGQVFSWDTHSQRVRGYETVEGCGVSLSLAANNGLFSLAWGQASRANPDQAVPWRTFNSEGAAIPMVRR